MSRKPFDSVTPAPGPRKPLRDGIPVGAIRVGPLKVGEEKQIPCPHCGDNQWRTQWQTENHFKCWVCQRMSNERMAAA